MINALINNIRVEVTEGTTILEAARKAQIKIPTLCKHPDLPPGAGCGLCIVKIKGSPKMFRACSTPIEQGMEITTHDPQIVAVRRTVIELILSNHPNDCLQCGRNNNCELQSLVADFGIRKEPFAKFLRDIPQDDSTRTIVLSPQKCILCGRCVKVCQEMQDVWALSFLERGISTRISPAGDIRLADSPCIRCGQCSNHCPTGAIVELDETMKVWESLQNPDKYCVVQIAPAVRVAIGEAFGLPIGTNVTKKLYALLRRLGFKAVFDTNFGADVTIMEEGNEFIRRLHPHIYPGSTKGSKDPHQGPLPLITTCCPAWVDFMEKFHSDMIDHFSTCKSPHEIVGVLSKTYYAQKMHIDPAKIFVVSIMPCTAKKQEIIRSEEMFASGAQDVDAALTTRELARMIKQAGVDFVNLPDEDPDHILGDYSGAGVIFGATGGVMEAAIRTAYAVVNGKELEHLELKEIRGLEGVKTASVKLNGETINVAVAHGLNHVEYVLNQVREAKKNKKPLPYHFIEVMACLGGCVGGGGQPYGVTDELRLKRAAGIYQDDREKQKRRSHENPQVKKLYEEFLGTPLSDKAKELLHTTYKSRPVYIK